MMSKKCENRCLKKVSVKTNRKILSLAVKLDVIRRIEEAGFMFEKRWTLKDQLYNVFCKMKTKLRMKMERRKPKFSCLWILF
jgi:hypothetical protein